MVDGMNLLDGIAGASDLRMVVVFGNHEFDKDTLADAPLLQKRIAQSEFRWLGANVTFASDAAGKPLVSAANLVPSVILTSGGIKLGIYGLVTAMKTPAYVASFADLRQTSRRVAAELRAQGAEVVVALTHLEADEDLALLDDAPPAGPDLVMGGHTHRAEAYEAHGRWVLKPESDARTATLARVTVHRDRTIDVRHEDRKLAGQDPAPDAALLAKARDWDERLAEQFCVVRHHLAPDCLESVVGHTATTLEAEELAIRSRETAFGDWLADRMREAFADRGADLAFINAGSLRLNRDIAAGSALTTRDIEELFAYPAPLRLIRIDATTLAKVAGHAVDVKRGSAEGSWLQVSGFAFKQDPEMRQAGALTLLGAGGPRPLTPGDSVLAVTTSFLLDKATNQDGYTMLSPSQVVAEGPDLKTLVLEALRAAEPAGIAPKLAGRICNREQPEAACLALGN